MNDQNGRSEFRDFNPGLCPPEPQDVLVTRGSLSQSLTVPTLKMRKPRYKDGLQPKQLTSVSPVLGGRASRGIIMRHGEGSACRAGAVFIKSDSLSSLGSITCWLCDL